MTMVAALARNDITAPRAPRAFKRPLDAKRIRLRRLASNPAFAALEGLEGARLVVVDDDVELARQVDVEVVALAFGLGAVDHADGALEARAGELVGHVPIAEVEQEPWIADAVEERLGAAGETGAHVATMRGLVPVV